MARPASALAACALLPLLVACSGAGAAPAQGPTTTPTPTPTPGPGPGPVSASVVDHTTVDASVLPLGSLDVARSTRVLFGHQSVGRQTMAGLAALASQDPARYAIVIGDAYLPPLYAEPTAAWFATNAGIGSYEIGVNGDPASKTAAFDALVRGGRGAVVKVALMKFCFDETYAATSGQPIWDLYRTTLEALVRDFPGVTFVWTTMPLHLVGNAGDPYGYGVAAYEFNGYVRSYVARNGGFLLDLADIESHAADGTPSVNPQGRPTVAPAWAASATDPHLDAAGMARMANAWWVLMARVATRAP